MNEKLVEKLYKEAFDLTEKTRIYNKENGIFEQNIFEKHLIEQTILMCAEELTRANLKESSNTLKELFLN